MSQDTREDHFGEFESETETPVKEIPVPEVGEDFTESYYELLKTLDQGLVIIDEGGNLDDVDESYTEDAIIVDPDEGTITVGTGGDSVESDDGVVLGSNSVVYLGKFTESEAENLVENGGTESNANGEQISSDDVDPGDMLFVEDEGMHIVEPE